MFKGLSPGFNASLPQVEPNTTGKPEGTPIASNPSDKSPRTVANLRVPSPHRTAKIPPQRQVMKPPTSRATTRPTFQVSGFRIFNSLYIGRCRYDQRLICPTFRSKKKWLKELNPQAGPNPVGCPYQTTEPPLSQLASAGPFEGSFY